MEECSLLFTPLSSIDHMIHWEQSGTETIPRIATSPERSHTIDSEPFVCVDIFRQLDNRLEVSFDNCVVAVGLAQEQRTNGRRGSLWLGLSSEFTSSA